MGNNNKVFKNYIYNTLYQILVLLAPLVTTPYVSRVLGADGVGIYNYAQSIATYFVLAGAVGTTLYAQREIAYVQDDEKKRSKIFWEIVIFRFITVLACSLIFTAVFCRSGENVVVYRILILEVLATAFDISWFFMGMENFKLIVIRNTIIKLAGIVLLFVLVKTAKDVPMYTLCLTIPILLGNISLWFNIKKNLVKLDCGFKEIIKGIGTHIKPILILFIPQIASEVYLVLDKTMIGVFGTGMDQVGYYTQGQKIIKIVLMIGTSLGTVMLPAMSAAFTKGDTEGKKKTISFSFKIVFMLSCPLLFGLCAVASRFVPIFFGEGYDAVVPLMIVISPILIIIGMSNVIGKQYLLPTKQQTAYTMSIVAGAVTNFILNLILIRFFNAIGASIATVFAEIAVTFVQCWNVRKQLNLWDNIKPVIKYLLMAIIMFFSVWGIGLLLPVGDSTFMRSVYLAIMILVGIVVYLLELILSKDEVFEFGMNMILKKIKKKNVKEE